MRFVGEDARELTGAAERRRAADAAGLPLPDRPAIAVLPFTNMSGEAEQDYFSDGISEDIITALSKLRWFFVIARNSSFIYKGQARSTCEQVAERARRALCRRGQRPQGRRPRPHHRAAQRRRHRQPSLGRTLRPQLADVFAVQDEITEAIVAAIEPQLYAAENFRAQRKPPDSMDAWDLLMRALSHYWRVTRQDHVVAQALLEKAIAHRSRTTARRSAARHQLHVRGAYGLGGHGQRDSRSPSGRRGPRSAPTTRMPGRIMRSATSICSRGVSRIRSPSSRPRCGSIRTLRWRRAIMAWRWLLRALAGCRRGRAPRDPPQPARSLCSAVYFGIAAYARFLGGDYEEAIRLAQEALAPARRLRRRAPGADRGGRHGGPRRDRQRRAEGTAPRPAERLARLDRRVTCRSGSTPTASTISKAFAGPA